MDGIMNKLRNLDAYPKINEDFYRRTLSGGVITVVSSIVMLLLFFSEFQLYLNAVIETKLVVDTSRGETLRINFDITFPVLACSILSIDAMDISGKQHLDVRHDIVKKRIDSHGKFIEARQDGIGSPKVVVSRGCFDDTKGAALIKNLAAKEPSALGLDTYHKQYYLCLAAAAATIKWTEVEKGLIVTNHSLLVTFNGSFDHMIIDATSVQNLEIIEPMHSAIQGTTNKKNSLFLMLKTTKTTGGTRLLRANLLQPLKDIETINTRLDCLIVCSVNSA